MYYDSQVQCPFCILIIRRCSWCLKSIMGKRNQFPYNQRLKFAIFCCSVDFYKAPVLCTFIFSVTVFLVDRPTKSAATKLIFLLGKGLGSSRIDARPVPEIIWTIRLICPVYLALRLSWCQMENEGPTLTWTTCS